MTILNLSTSNALRDQYVQKFVNTTSSYYKKYIEKTTMYSDGLCYTGYLWDCIFDPHIISENQADQLLQAKQNIYIMWDIHSCENISIPNYWKFPKTAVLYLNKWNEALKNDLPEDIYIFDETMRWSIVYTHETDTKNNPWCLFIGT